jgi:DNA polymerase III delta subunit
MLYILHGADFGKRSKKIRELTDILLAKKPGTLLVKIEADEIGEGGLKEYIGGQGLFERKLIIVLSGLLDDKEKREEISGEAENLAASDNIFITTDESIPPKLLADLSEHAEKVQEFSLRSGIKTEFNIFGMADAVGARDRMASWVNFLKAVESGAEAEEIHGVVLWQMKNIALAKTAEGSAEKLKKAGVSPFVAGKAIRYSKNYTESELKKIMAGLVALYHDSHRGMVDLMCGLEKFILETV